MEQEEKKGDEVEITVRKLTYLGDMMFMMGLNEIIEQMAMANIVRWYGHVLRRALNLEV